MNAVYEWDWTGVDTTNTVDRRILCLNNLTTTNCEVDFHPAFSSEALMAAYVCSASSSTLGGNVTWVNVMTPNSNPGGDFISSGNGLVSVTPGTAGACGNNLGMILGLKASGATETCESDISWNQDEAEIGSSGSPSTSAFVNQVGDLIITTPWCITNGSTTCTVTSPLAGSDTMTDITVDGTNSSSTGQGHIYYVLSASAAGTQTITFTPSGTFLHAQIAYWDYTPSPGCTFSHHTDFSLGSGTGTAVNLPSFTPTTGDLLFAFAFVSNHTSSVNSGSFPWACRAFLIGATATQDCTLQNTINASEYMLANPGGTMNVDFTQLAADPWQVLATSFTLSGSSPGNTVKQLSTLGVGE